MSPEKLKEEIYKYPCLYNKECPAYKDRNLRKTSWEKVAKEIFGNAWNGMTNTQKKKKVQTLQNKWSALNRKLQKISPKNTPPAPKKNLLQDFLQSEQNTPTGKNRSGLQRNANITTTATTSSNLIAGNDETAEDTNEEDEKLSSLFTRIKSMRKKDKVELIAKISQWIEEYENSPGSEKL